MKDIIVIQAVIEKNVPYYFIILLFLFPYESVQYVQFYDHVIYVVT